MKYLIIGAICFFIAIYCGALTGFDNIFIFFILGAVLYVIYLLIKNALIKNNEQNQPVNDSNNPTTELETNPQNHDFSSKVEDVEKLKKLLDEGIITQEEFEIKKKELLGL